MKTVSRGRATVLSLGPEDLSSAPLVEAAFREIMVLLRQRHVVIDMKSVTHLTSMGLSALSAGADIAREQDASFSIAGARPEVRRFIERIRDVERVQLADDVASALASLEKEAGEDETD